MTMTMMLAALLAAAALPQQQADTTVAARSGGTLVVDVVGGSVSVRTWDREAVRVRSSDRRVRVAARPDGQRVSVSSGTGGARDRASYEITVPRSFGVRVDGVNVGADVQGVQGDVAIGTLEGPILVRGVTGAVTLESVSGELRVEDVTGRVAAKTVNQSIRLARIRGDVMVEAVNGGIVMRAMDAARVSASTMNGLVEYDGTIHDGGRYILATHNGRITMSVPETASATISVQARSGRVESAFPVPLSSTRGERVSFRVGAGSAVVDLQSFNGTVRLVRPAGR